MRECVDYVEIQGLCFSHTSSCLATKLRGHPCNRSNGKTCNAHSEGMRRVRARKRYLCSQMHLDASIYKALRPPHTLPAVGAPLTGAVSRFVLDSVQSPLTMEVRRNPGFLIDILGLERPLLNVEL